MRSCRHPVLCYLPSRMYSVNQCCSRQINDFTSNRPRVALLAPSWASWVLMSVLSLASSVVSYPSCIEFKLYPNYSSILVNCNPITAVGISPTSCVSQPLCCSDNSFVSTLILHSCSLLTSINFNRKVSWPLDAPPLPFKFVIPMDYHIPHLIATRFRS